MGFLENNCQQWILCYSAFCSLTADLACGHIFFPGLSVISCCCCCCVYIMCVCLHKHSQVGLGVKPVIKDHTVTWQACDLSTSGLQFVLRRVFTGSPRNTIFALRDGQKRKWTESLSQSSLGNHLVVQWCPDPTCQSRWEQFFLLLLCSGAGVT